MIQLKLGLYWKIFYTSQFKPKIQAQNIRFNSRGKNDVLNTIFRPFFVHLKPQIGA